MVAGCGMTCIKYIMFAINLVFFLIGVATLALGIYALVDNKDMDALTKIDSDGKLQDFNAVGLLQQGAIVLIVAGSFLVIIGFLGCCGAAKESKCLLGLFAAIIILIVIVQIAAAALAVAFRSRIEDGFKTGLKQGLSEHYDGFVNSSDPFSRSFDFAQVYFECCGVEKATDFANSTKWQAHKGSNTVPLTCCALKDRDGFLDGNLNNVVPADSTCQTAPLTDKKPNTSKPCYDSLRDWVSSRATIIIGIGFGILAIEIIAFFFAICLCKAIGYETIR